MDGIKKPIYTAPKKVETPTTYEQTTPYFQKREELYIPREETLQVEEDKIRFQKGKIIRKTLLILLVLAILAALFVGFFFLWKTYSTTKKMSASTVPSTLSQDMKSMLSPIVPGKKHELRGENNGRINILLLGAAGEKKPGGNLTDTVMIMSIDTKNKKVALLSLPRDFYVPIPASTRGEDRSSTRGEGDSNSLPTGRQAFTKINSLYKIGINQQKGVDLTKQAVEKVTGVKINYFITVDFDAFAKIIDDLSGINVMVERDIYDPTYPGPNYSYETFALTKGAHLLDGNTALKYVRERHDDPQGDFGRAKRQQQVIQAVKNRLFSMQTLFNVVALNNVLSTLGENVKTDISYNDLDQFIKLSKTLDTQNITNVVVDAWKPDSLLKVSHVMVGNDRAFILVPRVGNYSEIQDLAQNIFNQTELKKRREAIVSETANITIVNKSGSAELGAKIKKLLSEKLTMKNVRLLSSETSEDEVETSPISTVSTNDSGAGKIFTLDELIKKLPAKMDSQKTDSENEITITLGTDLIEVYKYEEDSIEDFNKAQDSNQEISNY